MKRTTAWLLIPAFALAAAAASAAPPKARTLDLSTPNFFSSQWQERLQGPTLDDVTELPTDSVVVTHTGADKWNNHFSPMGIGSLFWAALNPAQAWRIVLPVKPGDEFVGDSDVHAVTCTTSGQVANLVTYCP
jgi:hypothetical protein